jgi:hypothetical protein
MDYQTTAAHPMAVIDDLERKQYINSFCKTQAGTWVVSVTTGQQGKARVYVRRSEDKGQTWSPERIWVFDPHDHPDYGPDYDCEMGQLYPVPDPIDGKHRIYQFSIVRNVKQGARFGKIVYTISEDDGRTWLGPDGPQSVYDLETPVYAITGHTWCWHLMAPPRLMPDGRVYLPTNPSTDPNPLQDIRCEPVYPRSRNILTERDPAKITFDFRPPPPHGVFVPLKHAPNESHGMEAQIVPLNDGRLFSSIRTGAGCLYFTTSGDNGETWSEAKPLRRDDDGDLLLNPNCACPLTKLSDGRYVQLHCNNDGNIYGVNDVFNAGVVRTPVYVSVGVDNDPGKEQPIRWSEPRLLTEIGEDYQKRFEGTATTDLTYAYFHEEAPGEYYHFYNARWESIQVNRIDPAVIALD